MDSVNLEIGGLLSLLAADYRPSNIQEQARDLLDKFGIDRKVHHVGEWVHVLWEALRVRAYGYGPTGEQDVFVWQWMTRAADLKMPIPIAVVGFVMALLDDRRRTLAGASRATPRADRSADHHASGHEAQYAKHHHRSDKK